MKRKTLVSSVVGALLVCASGAGAITAPGVMCQPGLNALVNYVATGTRHTGGVDGVLVCPVATGANLGTHVQWAIRVVDNSAAGSIWCRGYTLDSSGFVVTTATTATSANGGSTLTATSAFQTATSHTHVAECSMPAVPAFTAASEIQRVEVF